MDSILSVGIDIGTTTTSMIVSRISFDNMAVGYMVPKVDISHKEILYKSKIYATPTVDENHLNGDEIRDIIDGEYKKAGISPEDVDSGAVIITGESLLKDNAEIITEKLSDYAGEFVVAAAGAEMESVIAGKGSGIQEYSRINNCTAANIDIGGGTSNIAVFSYGELMGRTSLDIGGRLIAYDEKGVITYVSPRVNDLVKNFGFQLVPEEMTVTPSRLEKLADIMISALFQVFDPYDNELAQIALTAGCRMMRGPFSIQSISLSGGVADCYFTGEEDIYKYNDLGVALARSIGENSFVKNVDIVRPAETIRATVVGAGIYTMTVSGSTITYSDNIFPVKNIPVLVIDDKTEAEAFDGQPVELAKALLDGIKQTGSEKIAIGLRGRKKVSYAELCNLAEALACCSDTALEENFPLMVITESDMAKSLGQTIQRYQKKPRTIVCMDKLEVNDGDYIDIGSPVMNGIALPVVVKTLIFK